MSLPKRTYRGQKAHITMMELCAQPGEVVDCVEHGMRVEVTKQGKPVAIMMPPDDGGVDLIIHPDGSFTGTPPLTFRRNCWLRITKI